MCTASTGVPFKLEQQCLQQCLLPCPAYSQVMMISLTQTQRTKVLEGVTMTSTPGTYVASSLPAQGATGLATATAMIAGIAPSRSLLPTTATQGTTMVTTTNLLSSNQPGPTPPRTKAPLSNQTPLHPSPPHARPHPAAVEVTVKPTTPLKTAAAHPQRPKTLTQHQPHLPTLPRAAAAPSATLVSLRSGFALLQLLLLLHTHTATSCGKCLQRILMCCKHTFVCCKHILMGCKHTVLRLQVLQAYCQKTTIRLVGRHPLIDAKQTHTCGPE